MNELSAKTGISESDFNRFALKGFDPNKISAAFVRLMVLQFDLKNEDQEILSRYGLTPESARKLKTFELWNLIGNLMQKNMESRMISDAIYFFGKNGIEVLSLIQMSDHTICK